MLGLEFRLGWLVQITCIVVSGLIVAKLSLSSKERSQTESEELYAMNRKLKVITGPFCLCKSFLEIGTACKGIGK